MADSVQRHGRDTFVNSDKPDTAYQAAERLRLTSGAREVFTYLPLPGIRKRTIEQATLTCPVKGSWAAQTLTVTPVAEDWAPRKTTWNNRPTVRTAQAITSAQSAKSEGERISIDVTDHVQKVADGAKHFGWKITTNSSANNRLYAFNSPDEGSWVLTVDFIEAPEAPTDLSPNGNVVSREPVLTFDFTDLGGESAELASARVQVNTSASSVGAWDSGHIDTTEPQFDLSTSAWPVTPVSGTRYYWRVFVKDGAGYESDPSDWASFVYAPKPTLTIDNPATGIAWDPTPTIAAHISTGTIKAWRIRICRGSDRSKELYDSGKMPGTGSSSLAHTIPFRDERKRRILKDDQTYWLNVRVWDRNDREATPGDPTWVQQWVQFVLDDDLTPPAPSMLAVTQVGDTPRIRLVWQRDTGFPEGWVIRRDSQVIARLDPDEVIVDDDANTYEWIDLGAAPWVQHEYTVKVIDGGKQSAPSPTATITPEVDGVWLLSDEAGDVVLAGVDVGNFKSLDKRATYSPINGPRTIDIVHSLGGVAGAYTGVLDTNPDQDWDTAVASLRTMRNAPDREVQLVYGSASFPVRLRNMSALPSSEFLPATKNLDVSFEAWQTSDFGDD